MSFNKDKNINLTIMNYRKLPPSSMHSFIKARKDIPNMLISDYKYKYQHSKLDQRFYLILYVYILIIINIKWINHTNYGF